MPPWRRSSRPTLDSDLNPYRSDDVPLLSFGHGPHSCIGARLAWTQISIALPELFKRFPDLHLAVPADELTPTASCVKDDVDTLPVRLTA
ncbi:MAG TPA: cytochrome P450 [Streptomyces sp.]|nr:cytochrome P450 [Streptomyces sp.]